MYSQDDDMGLVKTRRLMAMQKQQRAKAGMRVKALPKGPSSFQPTSDKMRAVLGMSAPTSIGKTASLILEILACDEQ